MSLVLILVWEIQVSDRHPRDHRPAPANSRSAVVEQANECSGVSWRSLCAAWSSWRRPTKKRKAARDQIRDQAERPGGAQRARPPRSRLFRVVVRAGGAQIPRCFAARRRNRKTPAPARARFWCSRLLQRLADVQSALVEQTKGRLDFRPVVRRRSRRASGRRHSGRRPCSRPRRGDRTAA